MSNNENGDHQRNLRSFKLPPIVNKTSTPNSTIAAPKDNNNSIKQSYNELLKEVRSLKEIVLEVRQLKTTIETMATKYEELLGNYQKIMEVNNNLQQQNIHTKVRVFIALTGFTQQRYFC